MIVVVRKTNILLIALIFILAVVLYSINVTGYEVSSVSNGQTGHKTVIVDAGHGGEDPGAVSKYTGIKEKDINLSIASKLKDILERENYKVIMTREEDKLEYQDGTTGIYEKRLQDLTRRKNIMDEGGADIVVSIHQNKIPETQYFGAQVFYPPNRPECQKLASCIQKCLKESVDPANTRVAMLKDKPIIILKDCKTTTVVVECGFLSNQEEEKKLTQDEYQDKLANAIKDGINLYFEGK